MSSGMEGLRLRITEISLVSLLKQLAKHRGITLYRIAQELEIKRSSIYYYDSHPERIPLEKVEAMRKMAGLSWAEFGKWIEKALK